MSGSALDQPYELSPEQQAAFGEEGFVKLPAVLDEATLAAWREEIAELALEKSDRPPLEERDTYGKAFVQVTNLWQRSEAVEAFVRSRRLARIATALLGTRGVRLYHDQALFKEPGGGATPWHVDQQYWPLASSLCVTAWIPLQAVSLDMGPLAFAVGSHRKNIGRDLPISDESEARIADAVRGQGLKESCEPFDLGDVSFHLGWTLHHAGANQTPDMREVFTIIYMDCEMRLAEPANPNQQRDWEVFSPSTRPGEILADPLNPVLFSDIER